MDMNVKFLNYTLSHARYAIWLRGKMAQFEDKGISVRNISESELKKKGFIFSLEVRGHWIFIIFHPWE